VGPAPSYKIEKVSTQGFKLTSKNSENNYAVSVLGSSKEASATQILQSGAWETSVGVEAQGTIGVFLKTNMRARFTELVNSLHPDSPAPLFRDVMARNRRVLEEFFFTTQFLGDRVTVTTSRRASELDAFGRALQSGTAIHKQDEFKAWLRRSRRSSLWIEGTAARIEAGFQENLAQTSKTKGEELEQLRLNFSYGRARGFIARRDARALAPDQNRVLSHQSDVQTGASLGFSDLNRHGLFSLLPDTVWVSANHGTIAPDGAPSALKPVEKLAMGVTRKFSAGSVNLSYWRSAIGDAPSLSNQLEWLGRGMDIGGTLRSGSLSVAGNLSWFSSDNMAAGNNTAKSMLSGGLYLTWSRSAWPSVSAGVSNYAYQSTFFDYGALEQNSLMRYELVVSSALRPAWANPNTQMKLIASYEENRSRSQWTQTQDIRADNLFFGVKLTRSTRP
jgi:hypothetical protein